MKEFIRGLSRRTVTTFFGTVYAITLLFALFPPLYLAGSGIRTPVLGLPFSITYWILDALVLGLSLLAFYHVEDIRGELDEDLATATPHLTGE
jgi:TRAP-type C4-dicarboxylate transport system permease small subunit